jgi:hypothetical protein
MLTSDPLDQDTPRRPARRRTPAAIALLTLAAVVVLVLRHDYWNWDTPHPLLFGFLPIGLWWQALVSLLACGLMWLMVTFAWPGELEDEALRGEQLRRGESSPGGSDANGEGPNT